MFSKKDRKGQHFRDIVYPHVSFLYNMALRYAGNTYDAEDMVQETLYIALKKLDQLRDESKCKSWLFAILRSIYLRELRTSKRKHEFNQDEHPYYTDSLETAAENYDTEKTFEKKIEQLRVHRFLDDLPEKYKSLILLYYMEDMSYREISEYLDIPQGTVMSRLSRAKELLKKKMLSAAQADAHADNVVEFNRFRSKGSS
ncbi:MAG: sigma-70 family RNA polymerase sigma factor [Desulfobacterales bacterium]|nr:sigma-70 family RNA polymerase sigma factor [Desulfobacterales bacterium]